MNEDQPVSIDFFITRMRKKWGDRKYVVSDPLCQSWSVLCNVLNEHAQEKHPETWSVLPLPTGAGKTEGLISYCAELSGVSCQQGVLIVTNFTDEVDRIAADINKEADQLIAVRQHSKLKDGEKLQADQLYKSQVLVTTHSTYKKALAYVANNTTDSLHKKYSEWQHGKRLVVIDEVLKAGDPLRVNIDDLRIARHSIPLHIERSYVNEMRYIDQLMDNIIAITKGAKSSKYLCASDWEYTCCENRRVIGKVDIEPMLEALMRDTTQQFSDLNSRSVKNLKKLVHDTLNNLIKFIGLEGYYSQSGNVYSLEAIQLLLPTDIESAVILDATAKYNQTYNLLGSCAKIIAVPDNIRNYSNVNLNVLYGVPVGKESMKGRDAKSIGELVQSLSLLDNSSEYLFCVHKDTRDKLMDTVKGLTNSNIAHWGAIDGKNSWHDLSGLVICGLPYLGQSISEGAILSFDRWIKKTNYKYHKSLIIEEEFPEASGGFVQTIRYQEMPEDMWQAYESSHISVSVIQAINRVRCRNSIDEQGNCKSVSISIFLHKESGRYEVDLLRSIQQAMPKINISEKTIVAPSCEETLAPREKTFFDILNALEHGDHCAKAIMADAMTHGISKRQIIRFQGYIKDGSDRLFAKKARSIGVSYVCGKGRYPNARYKKEVILV